MQELSVADDREANINVVGNWRVPELGDLNGKKDYFEHKFNAAKKRYKVNLYHQ